MSVDLSGAKRELFYVNFTKVGKERQNGHQEYCQAKMTFRDAPLISNQSQYLVCATRWQIPTSEVPTIEAKGFEVWEYIPDDNDVSGIYVAPKETSTFDEYERFVNTGQIHPEFDHINFRMLKRFDIPAAFSAFQWFDLVKNALNQTIDYTDNWYGESNLIEGEPSPRYYETTFATRYSDRIKITMTPDMRPVIWISNNYTYLVGNVSSGYRRHLAHWYIKMDPGLFDMLQFQESSFDTAGSVDETLSNHIGMRFFGTGQGDTRITKASVVQGMFMQGADGGATLQPGVQVTLNRYFLCHTAATSAADTFNCHRKLVLTSDLITKQERTMTAFGGRKRQLVEYDLTQDTTFSYSIANTNGVDPYDNTNGFIGQKSTVHENLPSARTYTSKGGVDGRWMQMSSPSPLYQLEITASLIIWSFNEGAFKQLPIPIPAGNMFDVKLCFVNKDTLLDGNDHHSR